MELTQPNIDSMFWTILTKYQEAYKAITPWSQALYTKIPSTTRENRYAWLDKMPRMRKWVGERVLNNLATRSYLLVNEDWEDSLKLDRNVIEDDQFQIYASWPQQLADAAAHWPDDLLTPVIQNGALAASLCHDGQPFFNANHPQNQDIPGSPVQSNLYTAATSGALPLTAANYAYLRAQMMSYVGADGKPLGIVPNTLIIPTALEQTAKVILNAEFIAPTAAFGGNAANIQQTNVLRGSAQPLVVSQLNSEPTAWYLAQCGGPLNPFIFQERKPPTFDSLNRAQDANVFFRKELIFGTDSRGAMGYTLWFLCARAVG